MIDPFLAIITMVFIMLAVLLLHHYSHLVPAQRKEAGWMYACGERMHPVPIPSDNFYLTFRQTFPGLYELLDNLHNENLSDYLFWLLLVLALLTLGGLLI